MAGLNLPANPAQSICRGVAKLLAFVLLASTLCSCIETNKPVIAERDRLNVGPSFSFGKDNIFKRTSANLYVGEKEIYSFRYIRKEERAELYMFQIEKAPDTFETGFYKVAEDNSARVGQFTCEKEIVAAAKRYQLDISCSERNTPVVTGDFDSADMNCFVLAALNLQKQEGLFAWSPVNVFDGIKPPPSPHEMTCERDLPQTASASDGRLDGPRVALIIGNSHYTSMPSLTNPQNDAADVDAALRSLGFDTVVGIDLDRAHMNDVLSRFSRKAAGAAVAIVYYAGHGMQFEGKNYLLPTDANLVAETDVNRFQLLPVDDLIDVLALAKGMQLIFLDACRINPVEREFKNKIASAAGATRAGAQTRGFSRIVRSGLIVMFATTANEVAADADAAGRNSPFTSQFLKDIVTPNLEIRQVLNRVQNDVYMSTKKAQLPEITSQYVGPDLVLRMLANK
jgi:Caspase domain